MEFNIRKKIILCVFVVLIIIIIIVLVLKKNISAKILSPIIGIISLITILVGVYLYKNKSKKGGTKEIKILQWNILARGLADDGFLIPFNNTIKDNNNNDVTLDILFEKIKDAKEFYKKNNKDNTELNNLKNLFNTKDEKIRISNIINWDKRVNKIIDKITKEDPDIITLQENDSMEFIKPLLEINGYICTFEGESKKYNRGYVDDVEHDIYMARLVESRLAFIPKTNSNAKKFGKKDPYSDNDGISIFWKKDRFKLESITYIETFIGSKNLLNRQFEGVICVELIDKYCVKTIHVLSTHLPSGDEKNKEIERINTLTIKPKTMNDKLTNKYPKKEVTKDTTIDINDPNLIEFENVVKIKKNGVESRDKKTVFKYIEELTANNIVIFAMDANSKPQGVTYKNHENHLPNSVWQLLHEIYNFYNIWDDYFSKEGFPINKNYPISVNKMRGPASNQINKIGEHAFELIDHIYYSNLTLEQNTPPAFYDEPINNDILKNLMPNENSPSDHHPIISIFNYNNS